IEVAVGHKPGGTVTLKVRCDKLSSNSLATNLGFIAPKITNIRKGMDGYEIVADGIRGGAAVRPFLTVYENNKPLRPAQIGQLTDHAVYVRSQPTGTVQIKILVHGVFSEPIATNLGFTPQSLVLKEVRLHRLGYELEFETLS